MPPLNAATIRAVSLPFLAGLLVRAIPIVGSDFPLNDGGLFLDMIQDLQTNGFRLPEATSYNDLTIPFAYPPLGFYVAGVVSAVTGILPIDVLRFVPLFVATLAIPCIYVLARAVLASPFQALVATWAFALLPRAFDWLIVGGGITRSFGLLFTILATHQAVRFYQSGWRRHGVGMAAFAALGALSHPEAVIVVGVSAFAALLAYRRTWRAFAESIGFAVLAALVAAPWWASVIVNHGIDPFVSGSQTSLNLAISLQYLAQFNFTDEPYLTLLAAAGLVGAIRELADRRPFLPVLLVAIFVFDARGAATAGMVPLAMLVAVAVDRVLLAGVPRRPLVGADAPGGTWPAIRQDAFARLALGVALVFGIIGAVRTPVAAGSPLHGVSSDQREVMAWIRDQTPAQTSFLVITGVPWFRDATSEWFPVVAGRQSLATVQGYEWLGKEAWDRQESAHGRLQVCAYASSACLKAWTASVGAPSDAQAAWLFVGRASNEAPTGDCCAGLRESLAADPDYTIVFDGGGGIVARPR